MADTYLRQSPLAHLHLGARTSDNATEAGVSLGEIPHRVQIALRGDTSDNAFTAAIKGVTGFDLPTEPCTCTSGEDASGLHGLWMGPDEWLIVAPAEGFDDLSAKLATSLNGIHAAVVDVSESRTVLSMSGTDARRVLQKGCGIDFHPRAFSLGRVVNTLLARAHVTIHQINSDDPGELPAYELYVHRSFAEYLWTWLEDATREYGLCVA